jgi:hypothetical protein
MTNSITVRRTRESDWQEYRDLRLEMLADTPPAFGETLENARGWDEGEWRMRAARGEASDQILVAAIEESNGRWIGSMGGFIASGPTLAHWASTSGAAMYSPGRWSSTPSTRASAN